MPTAQETFADVGAVLDLRPEARYEYERRVASKNRVLDIGGRNSSSRSARRLRELSTNPTTDIVSTDVIPDYEPDLVDDISNTSIPDGSFDGVYCDAILEHVTEYWKAIDNIHKVLSDGGEAFFYVPFCYPFHDRMDYHRFTISEMARMLSQFSEVKVFVPEPHSGYGWVLLQILTKGQIEKRPALHARLGAAANRATAALTRLRHKELSGEELEQRVFYNQYLLLNHGFCAWVKK